ncbi:hypothetical protein FB45DRAFT_1085031 [Roridomyces roridus]|uniref:Uncharacterized protein n=1 Tax=Roridomyces roridus TaxID=1738132 RepID=A0AAD7FIS5_9AGAR|nr:hypothetical protein FB45DRAFT_1085031 [Roridomyces roridus]
MSFNPSSRIEDYVAKEVQNYPAYTPMTFNATQNFPCPSPQSIPAPAPQPPESQASLQQAYPQSVVTHQNTASSWRIVRGEGDQRMRTLAVDKLRRQISPGKLTGVRISEALAFLAVPIAPIDALTLLGTRFYIQPIETHLEIITGERCRSASRSKVDTRPRSKTPGSALVAREINARGNTSLRRSGYSPASEIGAEPIFAPHKELERLNDPGIARVLVHEPDQQIKTQPDPGWLRNQFSDRGGASNIEGRYQGGNQSVLHDIRTRGTYVLQKHQERRNGPCSNVGLRSRHDPGYVLRDGVGEYFDAAVKFLQHLCHMLRLLGFGRKYMKREAVERPSVAIIRLLQEEDPYPDKQPMDPVGRKDSQTSFRVLAEDDKDLRHRHVHQQPGRGLRIDCQQSLVVGRQKLRPSPNTGPELGGSSERKSGTAHQGPQERG